MTSYLILACHVLNISFSLRILWLFKEHGFGVILLTDIPFSILLSLAILLNLLRWRREVKIIAFSEKLTSSKIEFRKELEKTYLSMYGVYPYFIKFMPTHKKIESYAAEFLESYEPINKNIFFLEIALKMKNLAWIHACLTLVVIWNLYSTGVASYLGFLRSNWFLMGLFFMQIAGLALHLVTTCLYVVSLSIFKEKS